MSRVRRGRGFHYRDIDGSPVTDPAVKARIDALVIPPAWQDVWICPWPHGHIQATGVDAAGRRQYRYHDQWRLRRDQAKHERILLMAARLPAARRRFMRDLDQPGMPRTRVLAAASRLLDLGFFRIGSEQYAEDHGTYGLTTLRRSHVSIESDPRRVVFDYVAKSGKHRVQSIAEEPVLEVITILKRRRSGPAELLAYQDSEGWHHLDADDVNDYLDEVFAGRDGSCTVTAKDFRTWHGTVLMAVALALSPARNQSAASRKRVLARAYAEVAHYLGNTPAVCRASYIDPRIVDLWDGGHSIRASLDRLGDGAEIGQPATQGAIESAVRRLLKRV